MVKRLDIAPLPPGSAVPAKIHGVYGVALTNKFRGGAGVLAAVFDQAVDKDHSGPRPPAGEPRLLEQRQAIMSGKEIGSMYHTLIYGASLGLLQGWCVDRNFAGCFRRAVGDTEPHYRHPPVVAIL